MKKYLLGCVCSDFCELIVLTVNSSPRCINTSLLITPAQFVGCDVGCRGERDGQSCLGWLAARGLWDWGRSQPPPLIKRKCLKNIVFNYNVHFNYFRISCNTNLDFVISKYSETINKNHITCCPSQVKNMSSKAGHRKPPVLLQPIRSNNRRTN